MMSHTKPAECWNVNLSMPVWLANSYHALLQRQGPICFATVESSKPNIKLRYALTPLASGSCLLSDFSSSVLSKGQQAVFHCSHISLGPLGHCLLRYCCLLTLCLSPLPSKSVPTGCASQYCSKRLPNSLATTCLGTLSSHVQHG